MIKRLTIFGASSTIGVCVVQTAIDRGHKVRILVKHGGLLPKEWIGVVDIFEGDILHIEEVKAALADQDAVIAILGSGNEEGQFIMSEGLKNIIAVMDSLDVKVISACFPCTQTTEHNGLCLPSDHSRMFRILESSNLHWIAVSPPRITDDPATHYAIKREHNARHHTTISKYDLAKFLVDCLFMPERYQKSVEIVSVIKR